MLNEPPMAWFIKKKTTFCHRTLISYLIGSINPGKMCPCEDRVGMMIKLADTEQGAVAADGTVTKSLTKADYESLDKAKIEAKQIMEAAGVTGPFVDGMIHGGHLGGTVPLTKADVETMHPAGYLKIFGLLTFHSCPVLKVYQQC